MFSKKVMKLTPKYNRRLFFLRIVQHLRKKLSGVITYYFIPRSPQINIRLISRASNMSRHCPKGLRKLVGLLTFLSPKCREGRGTQKRTMYLVTNLTSGGMNGREVVTFQAPSPIHSRRASRLFIEFCLIRQCRLRSCEIQ